MKATLDVRHATMTMTALALVCAAGCEPVDGADRALDGHLSAAGQALTGSSDIVISQVYGGGANTGATYNHDFVELFNRGATTVSLSGWSVQYAASTGSSWSVAPLSGSIAPGKYYLIQLAAGTAGAGASLPTPDATSSSINLSATTGKVALVTSSTALTCGASTQDCFPNAGIRDFVGYGSANDYEGSGPAPTLSNTLAAARAGGGCTDTDNNASDFSAVTPAPRSSAATAAPCGTGGSIGNNGGTLSALNFAVVGDTRPPSENDTAGYPTAIVTQIYQDLAAFNPMPAFAVSTGDYSYSSPNGTESAAQYNLYMGARSNFPNKVFPAMGNHECTGYTTSNCGAGAADGTPLMYNNFLSTFLGPIGKTVPWYSIYVNAVDGSWTSKLIFIAANAWNTTQQSWLDAEMAKPTTYTFVIRHESASANTAPGVTPSEAIMAKYPYTLAIVGHDHVISHTNGREFIVGNGGAPLSAGYYGYVIVSQRLTDKAIVVDSYNYQTNAKDSSFHFAVDAAGNPAAP